RAGRFGTCAKGPRHHRPHSGAPGPRWTGRGDRGGARSQSRVTALRIRLPAKADNVAVVRQALTGLGDAYELDPDFLSDIRTAVTEACNNVVIHAYPGDDLGLLEVEADPGDGTAVDVLVRDYGAGLQPNTVPPQERSLGLGLPLTAALAHRHEIRGTATGGLDAHMLFA